MAKVTIASLTQKMQALMAARQPRQVARPAILGNGTGLVLVNPEIASTLVHLHDGAGNYLGKAINNAVPNVHGLHVIVGYDPAQPTVLQVLRTRESGAGNAPGEVDPAVTVQYPNVAEHALVGVAHPDTDRTVTLADGMTLVYTAATGLWTPAAGGAGLVPNSAIIFADQFTNASALFYGYRDFEFEPDHGFAFTSLLRVTDVDGIWSADFTLRAGTYVLEGLCVKDPDGCVETVWTIDGVTLPDVTDFYLAARSPNEVFRFDVTIPTSGSHVITLNVDDVANSKDRAWLTKITFYQWQPL